MNLTLHDLYPVCILPFRQFFFLSIFLYLVLNLFFVNFSFLLFVFLSAFCQFFFSVIYTNASFPLFIICFMLVWRRAPFVLIGPHPFFYFFNESQIFLPVTVTVTFVTVWSCYATSFYCCYSFCSVMLLVVCILIFILFRPIR